MMDPSSAGGGGGIGKAAQELMQEMQKAQQEVQDKGGAGGTSGASFQQTLQQTQQAQAPQQVQQINQVTATQQTHNVMLQAKVNANTPATRVGEAAKAERSRMAQMLDGLVGGQDKMTGIMKMALSGRQFNSQELLAMQAGIYRFSQELDLTGKVIEKATSGIKQTMNTQV